MYHGCWIFAWLFYNETRSNFVFKLTGAQKFDFFQVLIFMAFFLFCARYFWEAVKN